MLEADGNFFKKNACFHRECISRQRNSRWHCRDIVRRSKQPYARHMVFKQLQTVCYAPMRSSITPRLACLRLLQFGCEQSCSCQIVRLCECASEQSPFIALPPGTGTHIYVQRTSDTGSRTGVRHRFAHPVALPAVLSLTLSGPVLGYRLGGFFDFFRVLSVLGGGKKKTLNHQYIIIQPTPLLSHSQPTASTAVVAVSYTHVLAPRTPMPAVLPCAYRSAPPPC